MTNTLDREQDRGENAFLLAIQSVAALTMFQIACTGFESALLVLVAAVVGLVLPLRVAIPWLAAQTIAMGYLGTYHWTVEKSVWWMVGTAGFEVFGLLIASFAASETRARKELIRVNAELRGARSLLAQSSRASERVRISRDLHDLMGHHLTALSLHLEVASHTAGEQAREPIAKAQTVTRQLLGDVREVVSALRDEPVVDLREAVRLLVENIEVPSVHLSYADDTPAPTEEQSHIIVRSVQELLTNTVRHAAAENLWIELSAREGGIELEAYDDGRGAGEVAPGNGLQGMAERFEAVGGRLQFGTKARKGFWVNGWMPIDGGVCRDSSVRRRRSDDRPTRQKAAKRGRFKTGQRG